MAVLPPDTVVVITGASSGIGRAAAQAFAKKRARLVLAARDNAALEAAAGECHALGAEALALAADLSETGCAERVAVETFGRIDVWVNSAAVLLLGRFADLEPREFRCVVETNVLGYANGSRAALAQFRHQGGRGTLINVSSILGVVSEPYASACVASKFAIRGLTACIRQEMRGEPGIHICTILPAAMDTPIYEKAGNHFGHRAHSILPVYPAERAAHAIVSAAERPRREIHVGGFAHLLNLGARFAPGLLETVIARFGPRLQFESETQAPQAGNLFESAPPQSISGGWRRYWWKRLKGAADG